MPVADSEDTRPFDERVFSRLTRVEATSEALSRDLQAIRTDHARDLSSLRQEVGAGLGNVHVKLDAISHQFNQSQQPNVGVWISGAMLIILLAGAALVPVWITSANLKEGLIETRTLLKDGITETRTLMKEGLLEAKTERKDIEQRQFDHISSPGHAASIARFDSMMKLLDEHRVNTATNFLGLDEKLQREQKLQHESTQALMAELDKRLQREMRLRDLGGKESVGVGD